MTAPSRELRRLGQPRRGLRRHEAAAYIGISATKFDDWVARGVMPKPKRQDGVVLWDVVQLDDAFDALPDDGGKDGGLGSSAWD
jgi:predicted DNA-binding transcriptional regulator AlpA